MTIKKEAETNGKMKSPKSSDIGNVSFSLNK